MKLDPLQLDGLHISNNFLIIQGNATVGMAKSRLRAI